eukprot:CAMPEP_0174268066 /NCGR_PEP_ID=MMETSP0439-20130205/36042_1 /TAXON_ID=0 /ORGANISM="Stereomyxa ramosa, Strain Chinc5" /LENGTH=360 /DNA_ID=CAMNT_0015356005 /DNA_START=226 /DNA_END=1305 /DNA_ORIENTATION=-
MEENTKHNHPVQNITKQSTLDEKVTGSKNQVETEGKDEQTEKPKENKQNDQREHQERETEETDRGGKEKEIEKSRRRNGDEKNTELKEEKSTNQEQTLQPPFVKEERNEIKEIEETESVSFEKKEERKEIEGFEETEHVSFEKEIKGKEIEKEETQNANNVEKRDQNIILDLDGTLIDSLYVSQQSTKFQLVQETLCASYVHDDTLIFLRPGAKDFVEYCFNRFEHVAIWTAASRGWATLIIEKVLGRKVEEFSFVWCIDRCAQKTVHDGTLYPPSINIKPLRKVWRSKSRKDEGWNRYNTIIVEDNRANCMQNWGNMVLVASYKVLEGSDDYLIKLTEYLETDKVKSASNFRSFDKRRW